ncbi:MAG TPA: metallophosphoesterase [Bryobacteraceae bacterium]|nr:metallophosphoesterase [Bryobacteraceae bacterium]
MLLRVHFFPGLVLLVCGLGIQFYFVRRLIEAHGRQSIVMAGAGVSTIVLALGYLLNFQRVLLLFPVGWSTWVECAALVETVWLIALFLAWRLWRRSAEFRPDRRAFLRTAGAGLGVAPLIAGGVGVIGRNRFRLTEVDVPIPNLPQALQNLRIVQITDIHLSLFLSEREFARAIDMANETRADLALVTGDLITRRGDPLDACLRQLARLRAEAGVLGCLGNHEVYAEVQDYVTEQGRRIGIDFLRSQSKLLRFRGAALNFAGVDYQRMGSHYLRGAERLIAPGAVNVLLSHNPDVFPVAAAQGYDLTIAGHTHGGQVNVEILDQHLDVARFFTPFVRGLYRRGASSVYVSSGLGTIGVPVRLGAPAEVSLLRLCAT